jgi:hypothetical protein
MNKSKTNTIYSRNEEGLLSNTTYQFNEDGSINWRAMVKDEHLFPNKSWFESRRKSCPKNIDDLEDHQLLIKLSGIKEVAKLRGFSKVKYKFIKCEQDHVAVLCSIIFIPNFETGGEPVLFQDSANATLNNTSSFATKFLETIACNRAFVRCVRNFLNIHIVGDDEIDKSNNTILSNSSNSDSLSPHSLLKKQAADRGHNDFDSFMNLLRSWHTSGRYVMPSDLDPKSWSSFEDIPAKQAREFLKLIKN